MCKIMNQHALSYAGFAFMAARELAPSLKPKNKKVPKTVFNKALDSFNAAARKLTK